ncbi:F0F1 ATP synthase subunit B family protein [Azospirillum sp. sgz302134]
MHLDGWTLLLQAINFLVLMWLLRHFLYRPVLAVIAERQAATERVRAEAEAARGDADRLRHGLESDRAGLAAERDRLLADARAQAEAERAALIETARTEVDRLLADGRATLEEERRQALAGLRGHTAALGTAVAQRLLAMVAHEVAVDGAMSLPFLAAACRSVEALPEPQRRALAANDDPVPVRLVGAGPLPETDVGRCRNRLAAALGRTVALTVVEDPNLLAGVELRFPHTVLRHSWKQALADAVEELTTRDEADDDAERRA